MVASLTLPAFNIVVPVMAVIDQSFVCAINLDELPSSPPLIKLSSIPSDCINTIKDTASQVFKIPNTHPYQIEAIHHLAFTKTQTTLHLIRRIDNGKSLVPLVTGPLKGGGGCGHRPSHWTWCDQVSKASQAQFTCTLTVPTNTKGPQPLYFASGFYQWGRMR